MKQIPLTQGKWALVDDEDYQNLANFKWCATKNGSKWYAKRRNSAEKKHINIYMHREILDVPNGILVDHIDGDSLNNTKSNLRKSDKRGNAGNSKIPKTNTSGYKGVSKSPSKINPWLACIKRDGKKFHLGCFPTAEKAQKAYLTAAKNHFGKFANIERLN